MASPCADPRWIGARAPSRRGGWQRAAGRAGAASGAAAADLVFLRTLFLPLGLFATLLKASRLSDIAERQGRFAVLDGWRSEPAFFLALFCLFGALFALGRGRRSRQLITVAAGVSALVTGTLEVCAHYFHCVTGSAVDWVLVHAFLRRLGEFSDVVGSESNATVVAMLSLPALCLVAALRKRPWRAQALEAADGRRRLARLAAVGALASGLAALPSATLPWRDVDRNATLEVAASLLGSLGEPISGARFDADALRGAHLARLAPGRWRNLVVVMLESTRASATNPYDPSLPTTPFLAELARQSLLMERAYAVVPHTSKATVTTLCGAEPHLRMPVTESDGRGIPGRCLADLLGEQGFATLYSTAHTGDFEDWAQLVGNLGFREFVPLEKMGDTTGFEWAHYFGKEDDVALAPTRRWLEAHRERPFLVTYLTSTPHHDYRAPKRYGRHAFAREDVLNRYLNAVHYQDHFLRNLFDLFRELDLYEQTVFVLIGDHGQAFGEHGRSGHSNVPYEEGLRVPFLIHAPGAFAGGERIAEPVSQADVLPSALALLGYRAEGGRYSGRPVWETGGGRVHFFHCWMERKCAGAVDGTQKLVHYFDERPDELFDLAADPGERVNLAGRFPERVAALREQVLRWRRDVNGAHDAWLGRSGLARFLEVGGRWSRGG
jgi:arylsulfatase A-like enzyme